MPRIQLRRDTAANWTSANSILAAGEIGVEYTSDPLVTEKFKIGDGVTAWTTLPYFSATAGAHTHVESDTTNLVSDLAAKATTTALTAHDIDTTSVHGITDTSTLYRSGGADVAITDGGTGASTASGARTNLGVVIGTDVPALAHNHAGADINSGTVATARLGSGTADNTTFLRGDSTWVTPAGGASAPMTLTAPTASDTPLTLKGAASQTSDLLILVNNSNTVLAKFTSTGRLVFNQNSGSDSYCYIEANSLAELGTGGDFRAANFIGVYGTFQYNVKISGGDAGGGFGTIAIGNAVTLPSSNPSAGGIIYAQAGALKYRGSAGTITTLAPA